MQIPGPMREMSDPNHHMSTEVLGADVFSKPTVKSVFVFVSLNLNCVAENRLLWWSVNLCLSYGLP